VTLSSFTKEDENSGKYAKVPEREKMEKKYPKAVASSANGTFSGLGLTTLCIGRVSRSNPWEGFLRT
jgi:hypothetical protein